MADALLMPCDPAPRPRRPVAAVVAAATRAFEAARAIGPRPAAALDVPDSVDLAVLRRRVAEAPMVRVTGTFGDRVFRRPWLDSTGVRSAEWFAHPRPGVFVAGNVPPAPTPEAIGWSEITAVQTGRTHVVRGAVLGMLGAAAIGTTVFMATLDTHYEVGLLGFVGTVAGSLAVGSLVGASIGSSHGSWRTIYPETNRNQP